MVALGLWMKFFLPLRGVSSVRRALASKRRGPGFKSRPGTVGGPFTIIMWGARPDWKLALSYILLPRVNKVTLLYFTLLLILTFSAESESFVAV